MGSLESGVAGTRGNSAELGSAKSGPFGRRICVVGTTGSGKTTFAGALAQKLGCAHIELDALFWEPNWTEAATPVFRERVSRAADGERWVADGNYTRKAQDILWGRADTIVWLDYALALVLWRLVWRTWRRIVRQEVLWSGNRERWRDLLFTRESLFLWALQTHGRHRRDYPVLFQQPQNAHLTLVHLRSPREAERWMATVDERGPRGPRVENPRLK